MIRVSVSNKPILICYCTTRKRDMEQGKTLSYNKKSTYSVTYIDNTEYLMHHMEKRNFPEATCVSFHFYDDGQW